MTSPARLLRIILAMPIASLASDFAMAEIPDLAADGWHTWRVTATENAPDWCCYHWSSGNPTRKSCDLDAKQRGYGSSDVDTIVDEIQIYVQTSGGRPSKILALSSRCPVVAQSEILDLGFQATNDSVDWLEQYIDPPKKPSAHVLAAISTHQGDRALAVLMDVVRHNSYLENRKNALFWLAMSESDQAFAFLDSLLSKN